VLYLVLCTSGEIFTVFIKTRWNWGSNGDRSFSNLQHGERAQSSSAAVYRVSR
jgi:hypothetical protein